MAENRKLGEQSNQDPESTATTSELAFELMVESRLQYLRILAATILNELNSLYEPRSNKEFQLRLPREVHRFETQLIRNALRMSFGAQRRAAAILGIHPTTLHEKIKRLKIEISDETGLFNETAKTALDEVETEWPASFNEARTQFEIKLIERALEQTGGSVTKAAELLEMPITTLHYNIQRLSINAANFSLRKRGRLLSTPRHSPIHNSDTEA